jgi:hypothetical protein
MSIGGMFGMKAFEYGLQQLNNYQNSAIDYDINRRLMHKQQAANQALRRTAYQDTMYSMEQAGLNPILAYRQGGQSASIGLNSARAASSPPGGSPFGSIAQAVNTAKELKYVDEKKQAEINLIKQQTRRERTQGTLNNAHFTYQLKKNEEQRMINDLLEAKLPSAMLQADFKANSPSLNKWRALWDLLGGGNSANQMWQIPLRRIPLKR